MAPSGAAGKPALTSLADASGVDTRPAQLFDPVRFPGIGPDEEWPPPAFDFASPWLREPDLAFERGPDGQIIFVRRCQSLRLVLDVDTAHSALDVAPGSADFRLLRLVPSALRLVESVVPGDPVPPTLRGEPFPEPGEQHLYAATTALVSALERGAGEAGEAYIHALRRTPPGPHMFETAAARCVTDGQFELARIARLAKALQRLARAHAEVLAAHAAQPDYAGMERMVAATSRVLQRDAAWSNDLVAHALRRVLPLLRQPRETADALCAVACAEIERQRSFTVVFGMVERQAELRDRLIDLGLFWMRLAAAWASVHPETTDRREIEVLCRNLLRRLQLKSLYMPP
jgi:hypothetical protein